MWSEGLGMTAAAMNIDLNDDVPSPRKPVAPPRIPDASWAMEEPLPLREELAVSEADETVSSCCGSVDKTTDSQPWGSRFKSAGSMAGGMLSADNEVGGGGGTNCL